VRASLRKKRRSVNAVTHYVSSFSKSRSGLKPSKLSKRRNLQKWYHLVDVLDALLTLSHRQQVLEARKAKKNAGCL